MELSKKDGGMLAFCGQTMLAMIWASFLRTRTDPGWWRENIMATRPHHHFQWRHGTSYFPAPGISCYRRGRTRFQWYVFGLMFRSPLHGGLCSLRRQDGHFPPKFATLWRVFLHGIYALRVDSPWHQPQPSQWWQSLSQGHSLGIRLESSLRAAFASPLRGKADVLIVVSLPGAAQSNVKLETYLVRMMFLFARCTWFRLTNMSFPLTVTIIYSNSRSSGPMNFYMPKSLPRALPPLIFYPCSPHALDDQLNAQADIRIVPSWGTLLPLPFPRKMMTLPDDDSFEQTPTQEMEEAFASSSLHWSERSPAEIYVPAPLSYPWSRLIFDFKDLHTAWDRHIITNLIAAIARGMPCRQHPPKKAFSHLIMRGKVKGGTPPWPLSQTTDSNWHGAGELSRKKT